MKILHTIFCLLPVTACTVAQPIEPYDVVYNGKYEKPPVELDCSNLPLWHLKNCQPFEKDDDDRAKTEPKEKPKEPRVEKPEKDKCPACEKRERNRNDYLDSGKPKGDGSNGGRPRPDGYRQCKAKGYLS